MAVQHSALPAPVPDRGCALVTRSGLTFIGAAQERYLALLSGRLPAGATRRL